MPGRATCDLIGFGWADPSNEFLPLQKTANCLGAFN
jgi:hypothetical protein